MEHEFEDYPPLEWEPTGRAAADGTSDIASEMVEAMAGPCWKLSAFGICVERWHNNRLTLGLYLYGVKIGQKTIHADDPCVKIKEGNDLAKVKAEICIDFGRRQVVARGEVCMLVACARFNQVIFTF